MTTARDNIIRFQKLTEEYREIFGKEKSCENFLNWIASMLNKEWLKK